MQKQAPVKLKDGQLVLAPVGPASKYAVAPACDRERRAVLLATGLALAARRRLRRRGRLIEGLWLASVGSEDNRARVGLEIGRAAAAPAGLLHDRSAELLPRALPPLEPAGEGRWTIRQYEIEIALAGERLKVSGLVDDPVEMQRAAALPQRRPPLAALPGPGWPGGSDSAARSMRRRRCTRTALTSATPTA